MSNLLEWLHEALGDRLFILVNLAVALLLSVKLIPYSTDQMVQSAAGLTAKYLGTRWRTLVINCSTNNPELATMLVAFLIGRIGGIATPLGSNFANIYLIYIVALWWVLLTSRFGHRRQLAQIRKVLQQEKPLLIWHVTLASALFLMAFVGYRLLTGQFPIGEGDGNAVVTPEPSRLVTAALLSLLGVVFFVWTDRRMQRQRPELFEDIDDEGHTPSWKRLIWGTAGLLIACYIINCMFSVATDLYGERLNDFFGNAVFAALHYFLGALVTSLPEMHVAIANYRKATSPDLNTALASASTSNMSNLAIAGGGCLLAAILLSIGFSLSP